MRLATFIILSFLPCALPSKLRNENDKEESYGKIRTSNLEAIISGKDEQLHITSLTDIPRKNVNISSNYEPLIQKTNANIIHPAEAAHSKYVRKLPRREIEVATNVSQSGDSDGITYIPTKETNQTRDGIQHEFWNASRIFQSPAVTQSVAEKNKENADNKETGNKLARENEPLHVPLKNTTVENVISISLTDAKSSAQREIEFFQKQISDAEARVRSADLGVKNQTAESRDVQAENWEPGENDLMEAANFGLQAMYDLYHVQEPKLYSMGLYLGSDEPARYVAAFNDQSEEARDLARFGYAALQGTVVFLKRFPGAPLELPLSRSTRRTLLEQQCPRRGTPQCPPASLRYRTSDGSCNNLQNLWWGSAMSAMQRFLPAVYDDGIQSIRRSRNGKALPSAREITSLIHEDKDVPLASVTHMLMQWGQFVDHDLTATGQSRGFNGTVPQCCLPGGVGFQPPEFMHPECLPIAVNLRDSFYGPLGVRCLEFLRSGPAPKEGCEFGAREQLSQVTSYLDASMVYSSNALHSDSLRIFRNGLLQYGKIQSRRPSFPKLESDLCKRGSLSTTCFRAGDGRLSEQPALTSLHIVFLRLHNRIATELSALNPHWSDEKLFQETRRIVGAAVQHITYREFLPIILGPQVMKIFDLEVLKRGYYEGYDPTVNPTVANAFSTAAYRFGHSLVQRSFVRFDSDHRLLFNNVSIHDEFSNPANLETAGSIDRLLLGLVNQPCQRRDEFITEEMTNRLFQTPGFAFGMDLASLNIQRGRDHGLPPYVRWREPCGLSAIRSFEDLERVMSAGVVRKFKSLYSSVEDIDLYSAGLAEKSVIGGLIGPTFACIIAQQFGNLRRGDRFWYENSESESSFTAGQLQQIRQITLAQVLCGTIDGIETIQPFVFLATDTLNNQRFSCNDPAIGRLNLEFWTERSPEFRHNVDDSQPAKRLTTTDSSASRSKEGNANAKRKVGNQEQASKVPPQKPFKTSIQQNNRIVVTRPFGRPDNVTIVVQNNAVNSPVFVNEGVYGSRIRIQPKPIPGLNQNANSPAYRPHAKPIPTTLPHSASFHATGQKPYVPHAFNDPSNPNPLAYGYRSPIAARDDVFYDNYAATSPRPTLYTYYTSFQQRPTTRPPDREVDGYLINYGPSHHESDSAPVHTYARPKPPTVNVPAGQLYGLSGEHKPTQKPDGFSKPPASTPWPNSRPSYASNDEPHRGQKPDYNKPKPTFPTNSNDEPYHAQKPVHGGLIRPNSQPDARPNYQPHGAQRPETDTGNPYLHNNGNSNNNRPTESYSVNLNKPQQQWGSNVHQKRPSERPYDFDDPDLYHKRPNIKLQNGVYSSSGTNAPSYQEDTLTGSSNSPSVYSQEPVANYNNYNRRDATPAYQKRPTSTQSSWTDAASRVKEDSTRSPQNDSYSKLTGRPIYQKDDHQSQLSSYPKGVIGRPAAAADSNDNSYPIPIHSSNLGYQLLSSTSQNRPTPTSYSSETSTTDLQAHRQEDNFSSRPKVHSVTIVTDTVETVRHPGHSGYISQHKVITEIPRPLAQQTKNDPPVVIRKPGQYYYEKNVLHRYPDEVVDEIHTSNHYSTDEFERTPIQDRRKQSEKITAETSPANNSATDSDVIQSNESKSTTTPTLVITDYDNNADDVVDDLDGAFSTDVESIASTDVLDRMNHWMNPREDLNLPLSLEMPGIPSDEFANAKELPKPIKSTRRA